MTRQTDLNKPLHSTGNFNFELLTLEESCFADQFQRHHNFLLIWITEGSGLVKTECAEYPFGVDSLFAFSPAQPFLFVTHKPLKGFIIHFHRDLIRIYQTGKEKGINDVLYNHHAMPPFVTIDMPTRATFHLLISQMGAEKENPSFARHDMINAYLKILLINASRLKMKQQLTSGQQGDGIREHHLLHKLKAAIDFNFRTKHAPSDYSAMLFVSTKTLSKVTKSTYKKSLSNLINERIISEAKRELYLTKKTIKNIACDLGYEDEYYFSRFFKINTRLSPNEYRKLSV